MFGGVTKVLSTLNWYHKVRELSSELYCEQLNRMCALLGRRYVALVIINRVLFHQNSTRPHTDRRTLQTLEEFDEDSCDHIWLTGPRSRVLSR
ncbi:hypothetical protein Trydic_g9787 [Trypoxylus dichotomus]